MSSEYLNNYKPLVKFLAEVLGENCEVVLHDLNNLENSIIAIENGH
ncbi:MAG: PAS domain-containing protein, partial [Bacillota bacterium]